MGTVRRLAAAASDVALGQAADAYLATLHGAEQASTRRTYGRILRWVVAEFGADAGPGDIDPEQFAVWFTARWADRAPSTWNVSLDAVRSAAAYWQRQGWPAADFSRLLERRKPRPDRSRALPRAEVEQLLTRQDISLRERTLWRMLYETAARSAEVLALDIEDLDLPKRCARVRRKGGAVDSIVWQTGTARLLPRLLKGRTTGPVFVTERKARVQLPAADLDPLGRARLSYQQAVALFTKASGGATLHQLRHSALTHDAENGTGTPMLMKRSGHTSVRSLAKYARVSTEALMRHQAEHDPARRR
jgi:integrase/recombinase XerC/integrase/recombinase XerD